jgi:hypothetical protein
MTMQHGAPATERTPDDFVAHPEREDESSEADPEEEQPDLGDEEGNLNA